MKRHGFIPQADDAFLLWSRNFVNSIMDNAAKEALMRKGRMVTKLYIAWNPAASDAQRTSIPAPKTRPKFGFKVADIMRIIIP
ncbi:MAG: hypothetical protein LBF60_05295 [Treponema sp.]|jgi:hypothetical protein|nr:hypothetical protein [Treponema sp.]